MIEKDFQIGSLEFKLSKIHAFKQFHIVRRIAPILSDLAPMAVKISKRKSSEEMTEEQIGNWAKLANETGMMFDNLELPIMLQVAGRAFMYNLSSFFAVLPQASPGRE